jgi:hypothetical protein
MLDELLAGRLPSELGDLVVERAEGSPFFVGELLGMLIDRGLLARDDGAWVLRELPSEFAVPDSVHAVLAARIDLLGPAEKAALQAAAVIGRVFWTGPVYELGVGARSARARGSRPHSPSGGVAAWLEQRGKARDELASLLAHHYAEAVRPEDTDLAWAGEAAELERLRAKALLWLEHAAQFAIRRYEIHDAIALLERALSLRPDAEAEARLWRAVGKANALRFEGEAFWTAMQSSLTVCSNKATCADTYSELAFQTAIRSSMWAKRPDRALIGG